MRALLRAGFVIDHVTGSHYRLIHPQRSTPVTVPFHRRDLHPDTLRSILRQAGLTRDDLRKLL
ncbi:MAG: type II toxin-antitoxin system HicA family toxin [Deltaproteobacteria bacterium]|nr:type II toxin-antitoxin system HicA family toxin [Deltaproteobacteria bacterium]MBI3390733.1 type II toxin-antitoxin system HicA family toxin [Deltaproteobacteria bacterium]